MISNHPCAKTNLTAGMNAPRKALGVFGIAQAINPGIFEKITLSVA